VLRLALKLGAMRLGRVAIDGTKIKANASKHKAMSYERMLREEQRLREEGNRLLAEAEQKQKDTKPGKKDPPRRGGRGKGRSPVEPKPESQHNFTDPESRIMKGPDGFVQPYNAQAMRNLGSNELWAVGEPH